MTHLMWWVVMIHGRPHLTSVTHGRRGKTYSATVLFPSQAIHLCLWCSLLSNVYPVSDSLHTEASVWLTLTVCIHKLTDIETTSPIYLIQAIHWDQKQNTYFPIPWSNVPLSRECALSPSKSAGIETRNSLCLAHWRNIKYLIFAACSGFQGGKQAIRVLLSDSSHHSNALATTTTVWKLNVIFSLCFVGKSDWFQKYISLKNIFFSLGQLLPT